MSLILARVIVAVAIAVIPFLAFAVLSRQQHAGLIILVPLFGVIPAIVAALLIFWPVEVMLSNMKLAWAANVAIPLLGACLVFLTSIVLSWSQSGDWSRTWNEVFITAPISSYVIYIGAGVLFGVCWRLTEWLAKLTGLANG